MYMYRRALAGAIHVARGLSLHKGSRLHFLRGSKEEAAKVHVDLHVPAVRSVAEEARFYMYNNFLHSRVHVSLTLRLAEVLREMDSLLVIRVHVESMGTTCMSDSEVTGAALRVSFRIRKKVLR